ncbi:MAG TPA: von Willebrand factor type A domain-containing protein, partial [Thermoanaerobaculia bacterium]|nr:von Willebrand factor type A domain-containing protein [Thermoanaerobaculia bacterium]
MSRLSERDIARKLAEREDLEPPAGLLDRIKSEIPPTVTLGTGAPGPERRSAMPTAQRWLIAASLIATVGAGVFALRLQKEAPSMESLAVEEAPASAPAPELQSRAAEPEAAPEAALEQAMADEDLAAVERKDAPASIPPPPPPPPAPPAPPAMKMELREQGYIGPANEVDAQAVMVPEPVQPMEVADGVESGRMTGVAGGVVGGVAGGSPGGVPSAPAPASAPKRLEREQFMAVQRPAEPGQPYADVMYKAVGTNPFTETARDRLSTFGLDVDTGSYTVARRYIADGNLPDPRSVRVEEYVNYFNYGDPAPTRGDFAIRAEGAPSPFAPGDNHRLLRFNIRGRDIKVEHRRPVVMTFVVDVSGSMAEENRLELVKQSLSLLL